jgi:ATP-dependent DNA ligase
MRSLKSLPSREAGFFEPMEYLAVMKLPHGLVWVYAEIKLDGYRALAINANGKCEWQDESLFSKTQIVQPSVSARF